MSTPVDVADKTPTRLGDWSEAGSRVTITRRKFGRFGTWVVGALGVSPHLRITLDHVGTVAWNAMDGRTVAEVLAELERQFPEEGKMDSRLGQYLQQLVRAKLLTFD